MSSPVPPTLSLSLRIRCGTDLRIGPGKIRLLELIGETGSIARAARAMGMSYRRAWGLVTELNAALPAPAVTPRAGGPQGGRSELTPEGATLVARYRALEAASAQQARDLLRPFLT